jgi:hypothetical protein
MCSGPSTLGCSDLGFTLVSAGIDGVVCVIRMVPSTTQALNSVSSGSSQVSSTNSLLSPGQNSSTYFSPSNPFVYTSRFDGAIAFLNSATTKPTRNSPLVEENLKDFMLVKLNLEQLSKTVVFTIIPVSIQKQKEKGKEKEQIELEVDTSSIVLHADSNILSQYSFISPLSNTTMSNFPIVKPTIDVYRVLEGTNFNNVDLLDNTNSLLRSASGVYNKNRSVFNYAVGVGKFLDGLGSSGEIPVPKCLEGKTKISSGYNYVQTLSAPPSAISPKIKVPTTLSPQMHTLEMSPVIQGEQVSLFTSLEPSPNVNNPSVIVSQDFVAPTFLFTLHPGFCFIIS